MGPKPYVSGHKAVFHTTLLLLLIHSEQESGQAGNLTHNLAESPPFCSPFTHLQEQNHSAKHNQQQSGKTESKKCFSAQLKVDFVAVFDSVANVNTCLGFAFVFAKMQTQLVGVCLAIIGFLGTILICGLPMWKVTAFIGANIITAQVFWEGLWMNCVIQSTGHSQCKAYDSVLALPQELQASRALICVSIAVSVVAIGLTVVGARCTNFFRDDSLTKTNIGLAGGVVFILAGLLCVIPVSWSAHSIITGFYNPLATQERRGELGASIYVGWAAGALLIIGGGILCGTSRC